MNITNKHELPEFLADLIRNDDYDKGDCDFSITELLKPPRVRALEKKHKDEISVDVSEMITAFEGKILHKILESADRKGIKEKRYFTKVGKWTISAQLDDLAWDDKDPGVLSDWKRAPAFKMNKTDADWEFQLNGQNYILNQNGIKPSGLQIVVWGKDHSRTEAAAVKTYPQSPIIKIPIEMWSEERIVDAIKERIELHVNAAKELPECTDDERFKKYNRRFGKVVPIKCKIYCSVAPYCSQYQKELKNEI